MVITNALEKIYLECKHLAKADLHLHLNGLFDTNIIKQVLLDEDTSIPSGFDLNQDLNVLNPKRNLVNYLKPWDILRLIPKKQENLSRLIESGFENLSINNVKYVELRSSVVYLSLLLQKNLVDTLEILLYELKQSATKKNIEFRLIFTIPRSEYSIVHLNSILNAYYILGSPKEIVGLDLAGNEDSPIPKDLGKLFKLAKERFNFKITIHAGETGSIKNIHDAIYLFGADRIGHGSMAGKCEKTMELIAKKDICIEICPISNRRTGAIKQSEVHPVNLFIKKSVPFVVCSDNPGIHQSSLSDDFFAFYKETKRIDILRNMYAVQMKYSFK